MLARDEITDIYAYEDNPEKSLVFPGPQYIGEEDIRAITKLIKICKEVNKTDFTIAFDGYDFRGHRMETVNGIYYALRKMPKRVWSLSECGIDRQVRKYIGDARHNKGGLFVVSGMPGNGKSTTCAAIITERLQMHGGMCATVEDPVEMPLQGMHGEGFCLQRSLDDKTTFADAVRETMRAYPTGVNNIMLIGEVRDPETAALALRSSVDGRLVVITVHASDVISTVHRILTLAAERLGMNEARNLLASSLRLIMSQKLVGRKPNAELLTSTLFDSQEVVGVIRNPKSPLEGLKNPLQQQAIRLKSKQPIELRKI